MDRDRWPVVLLHVVGGGDQAPDFDSFLRALEMTQERQGRIVVVLDLTHARPDPKRRQAIINWVQQNRDAVDRRILGIGVVAPSAIQRGLVTAVRWFVKMPFPIEVFPARRAALGWAEEHARRAV